MALSPSQIEQQKKQAEELLFAGTGQLGFAKSLFFGQFKSGLLFPYPHLSPEEKNRIDAATAEVRQLADAHINDAEIDRNCEIPQSVIDGLARLGVLGMTAPAEFGG